MNKNWAEFTTVWQGDDLFPYLIYLTILQSKVISTDIYIFNTYSTMRQDWVKQLFQQQLFLQ